MATIRRQATGMLSLICLAGVVACASPLRGAAELTAAGELTEPESAPAAGPEVYSGNFSYIIGPGDTLDIKVWRHPDLENRAVVRPDGQISFPLLEDLRAADLTPQQLKERIAAGLSRIINTPEVTVNVQSFQSKKFFVLGEVNRPGVYPFEGRERVLDAMSKAGSYKETASLKSVILIKRAYSPNPEAVRINMYDVITKGAIQEDLFLEPGDIVFVPKTFIAEVDKFIDQFFTQTDPALRYYLDIIDIQERSPGTRSR